MGKRFFDFLVSLTGIIIFSPLIAWIVVRIRRESPGPIIYRGLRLGMDGKLFVIYKFRTMYEISES